MTDTGPGISSENQKKLFKAFEQIENTYLKKHEGTGLGLALCKKLVELHGGVIWVESEPEKGSAFKFIIPVDSRSAVFAENGPIHDNNMTDPVSRLLRWEYFIGHVKKVLSRSKTTGQHFVVLYLHVSADSPRLDMMQIARILKQKTRRYEAIAQGKDSGKYYIIILDTNVDAVDKVSSRLKQVLKKNGYNCDTKYLSSTEYEDSDSDIISVLEQF